MWNSLENFFLLKNLLIGAAALLFLLWKRLLSRYLSHRTLYRMDLLLLAFLFVPFLPIQSIFSLPILHNLTALSGTSPDAVFTDAALPLTRAENWMNSFSVSSGNSFLDAAGKVFVFLWILGLIFCLFLLLCSFLKYFLILHHAKPTDSQELSDIFAGCQKELGIRRHIKLYETTELCSPAFGGLFFPRIFVPSNLLPDCPMSELRFILLHELTHYRQKDAWISIFSDLAKVIYWFHPAVHYVLREMSADRELSCDSLVLQHLSNEEHHAYGLSLIRFAGQISTPFMQSSGIGGSKKQIFRRIKNIASYQTESKYKMRSRAVVFLTLCFFICCIPLLSASASGSIYKGFSADHVVYNNESASLDASFGSFVLYDQSADAWEIYGGDTAFERMSPDSSYKIYSALFALDAGIITPDDSVMSPEHTNYPFASWNQQQNLRSALSNSVNWYFQTLDNELGLDTLAEYFSRVKYGNEDLSGGLDSYWMESSLKISPVEQVELLQAVFENEYHFAQKSLDALRDAMFLETDSRGSLLYGKTGTGSRNGQNVNGWFVGYVVTDQSVYYFAMNKKDSSDAEGAKAAKTVLSILNQKGIFLSGD